MDANVIVARARIAGGVRLEREAPDEIRVASGQEILVKVPFRFDEVGDAREDYRIVLRTSIGGGPSMEERVEAKDRTGRSDARRGIVMQRHRLEEAGEHALAFAVQVDVERTPWQGGETVVETSSTEATLLVRVR